jgi:hypothetical protein
MFYAHVGTIMANQYTKSQDLNPKDLKSQDASSPMIQPRRKDVDPKATANLKFQRDKDREPVRGKFIFHEVPGGQMEFMFKKYKGDPLEKFSMVDGQVYTIPLGVAKHLNTNCWYPSYNYKNDDNGRPVVTVAEKVRRCSFQSLEFVDIEDVAPVGSEMESGSCLPK